LRDTHSLSQVGHKGSSVSVTPSSSKRVQLGAIPASSTPSVVSTPESKIQPSSQSSQTTHPLHAAAQKPTEKPRLSEEISFLLKALSRSDSISPPETHKQVLKLLSDFNDCLHADVDDFVLNKPDGDVTIDAGRMDACAVIIKKKVTERKLAQSASQQAQPPPQTVGTLLDPNLTSLEISLLRSAERLAVRASVLRQVILERRLKRAAPS